MLVWVNFFLYKSIQNLVFHLYFWPLINPSEWNLLDLEKDFIEQNELLGFFTSETESRLSLGGHFFKKNSRWWLQSPKPINNNNNNNKAVGPGSCSCSHHLDFYHTHAYLRASLLNSSRSLLCRHFIDRAAL